MSRVGLEKDRMGPMTWPKGEKTSVTWPCTGRRVSSLVPWGGSEEPETVEVSQDVVNRRGKGDWEGEGVGEGAGGEGEGGWREKEREQAREEEKEKARGRRRGRRRGRKELEKKEKGRNGEEGRR